MITKKSDWSQITKGQQNGVLQAIYECGTNHMRLRDYMNSTLVCWEWREGLLSVSRISKLQDIYRISRPLFNRFIDEANRIDQSNSPKFYEIQERGANDFNPMLVTYHVSLSQKDYEVRKLNHARELAMGRVYSTDEYNQLVRFGEMNDEDRSDIINAIKSINEYDVIPSFDINRHEINYLLNKYNKISGESNLLEKMFNENILPKIIKKETSTKIDFLSSMIVFVILLFFVILCGGLVLFY